MYCKSCGKEISGTSVFCPICGEKQTSNNGSDVFTSNLPDSVAEFINAFNLVFVEGGEFLMGATAEQEATGLFSDRKPVHKVQLSSFMLGKYPVTQELWERVMNYNQSKICSPNYPVTNITLQEALEFLNRLTELTGYRFRLPTEAEWEYAARGGRKSQGFKYPGSNNVDEVAWYKPNSNKQTHPVGEKKPNELGLYDMAGNVFEFCSDVYDSRYYKNSPYLNPQGPRAKGILASILTSASSFVCRGCSYHFGEDYATSSFRYFIEPTCCDDNLGFRYVVDIQ